MASSLRGLREYFEHYKEHPDVEISEVVVLQILYPGPELGIENPLDETDRRQEGFEKANNRIQLTDGSFRVHLNYQKEGSTLKYLYEPLQAMDYDPEHLDGAYFSIMNFRFSWHWIPEIKEVVLSLDTEDFRLVDAGLGQSKPRKTHYLTRVISKRRYEILKRDAISKQDPTQGRSADADIDLTEMVCVQSQGGVLAEECRLTDSEIEALKVAAAETKKSPFTKPAIKSVDKNAIGSQEVKPQDTTTKKPNTPEGAAITVAPVSQSEKENVETIISTAEMRRAPKITRAKKPQPGEEYNKIKTERAESLDEQLLDEELGDIEAALEKDILKVKMMGGVCEPVKRGSTRTAAEGEFGQPQTLGWSFAAFHEEQSN